MKRKDLADVLLKILGLSMCLNAIPGIFYQLVGLAPLWYLTPEPAATRDRLVHQIIVNVVSFTASDVVTIGFAIFIVVKSRKISEFLFKNEDG
jgi:hypothetical protein